MRILAVYRGLPWPIWEGYHLRVLHLFRRIRRRHEVHLLGLVHAKEQEAQLPPLQAEGIFSSITVQWLPKRSVAGRLRTNLGLDPPAALKAEYPGFGPRLRRLVQDLVQRHGIQCGYVFDPWADVLFTDAQLVPTLLDVCDCRSFYYRRRLERGQLSPYQRLRTRQLLKRFEALERYTLQQYPVATVVSPADRDGLLQLEPNARVEIIPNGVDLDMFAPQRQIEEQPGNLILFGNMDFLPNADAAIRFAREILPKVRKTHPEATFTIVGTNPLPHVRALAQEIPGVEVTGRVDDLKPWIARASMLVAPIRFGAGIKNKVLETMAMEKPVVCSATSVEAMNEDVAALVQLADSDADFAVAVARLLDDPARRHELGRRGRAAMQQHHSWDTAASRYEALLEELSVMARS
ncbi:MAG: glycosyltransferase [Planctomycetota bacterium]|nr:MAG: glycosyltransferase [Planctomycetota bacterium]